MAEAQSAAAIIVEGLTPLVADHVAAAALVDPALSSAPASLKTRTSHLAMVDLATGRKGGTVVLHKLVESELATRSADVLDIYSCKCKTGHNLGQSTFFSNTIGGTRWWGRSCFAPKAAIKLHLDGRRWRWLLSVQSKNKSLTLRAEARARSDTRRCVRRGLERSTMSPHASTHCSTDATSQIGAILRVGERDWYTARMNNDTALSAPIVLSHKGCRSVEIADLWTPMVCQANWRSEYMYHRYLMRFMEDGLVGSKPCLLHHENHWFHTVEYWALVPGLQAALKKLATWFGNPASWRVLHQVRHRRSVVYL